MTVDLSRRTFLIGSAAFVAAAVAPLPPGLQRSAAILMSRFPYRAIHDLELSFDVDPNDPMDQMGAIEFGCAGEEHPHHVVAMNMRGFYRWVAMPGDEIILTEDRGLVVNVWPAATRARIGMMYNVQPDPKKNRHLFCEELTWNGPGDIRGSEPMPLQFDYSEYPPVVKKPGFWARLKSVWDDDIEEEEDDESES